MRVAEVQRYRIFKWLSSVVQDRDSRGAIRAYTAMECRALPFAR